MALRNTHTHVLDIQWNWLFLKKCYTVPFNVSASYLMGLGDIRSDIKIDVNGKAVKTGHPLIPEKLYPQRTSVVMTPYSADTNLIFSGWFHMITRPQSSRSLAKDSDEVLVIVFAVMGVKH